MPRAPPTWAAATTPHRVLRGNLFYYIILNRMLFILLHHFTIYFTISYYIILYRMLLYELLHAPRTRAAAVPTSPRPASHYVAMHCIAFTHAPPSVMITTRSRLVYYIISYHITLYYHALAPCVGSNRFHKYQMNIISIDCIVILWTRSMTRECQKVCIANRAPPRYRRRWPAPPSA